MIIPIIVAVIVLTQVMFYLTIGKSERRPFLRGGRRRSAKHRPAEIEDDGLPNE